MVSVDACFFSESKRCNCNNINLLLFEEKQPYPGFGMMIAGIEKAKI